MLWNHFSISFTLLQLSFLPTADYHPHALPHSRSAAFSPLLFLFNTFLELLVMALDQETSRNKFEEKWITFSNFFLSFSSFYYPIHFNPQESVRGGSKAQFLRRWGAPVVSLFYSIFLLLHGLSPSLFIDFFIFCFPFFFSSFSSSSSSFFRERFALNGEERSISCDKGITVRS